MWSFDIKNAFLQADGFERDVFLHAPEEWDLPCGKRAWKLKAPAYELNDAPAAFRRSSKRHLLNSELSVKHVGLRCQAPTFDPCLFCVFRDQGQAVGAFTTHIDDVLGCGEPDVLPKLCQFSEQRIGDMELQENSSVHAGMELAQEASSSVTLTQEDFAKNLQLLGTSPQLWAARQKLLPPEVLKLRQCKSGELCCLPTVSRLDVCARLARFASRINSLEGADVFRINDLVKTVKNWQPATVLRYYRRASWTRVLWPRALGMNPIARERFVETP